MFMGLLAALTAVSIVSCGGKKDKENNNEEQGASMSVNANGLAVAKDDKTATEGLPYSGNAIKEEVVLDYGNRTIRTTPDTSLSFKDKVKDKKKLFIVMSKKDYYLYVYEPQGKDTTLIARYDCAFSLKKGQKEKEGDMRTPHCTIDNPFQVQQIVSASNWEHDFGDGRGKIKSYGDYFLRLKTPGHSGIGIHGSTNNRESVPGRASEGCIRLKDEDIKDLAENYATEGMKVVIKAENVDDYPFEIHAMKRQKIERKRHFDATKTLTNEQIATATAKTGRVKTSDKTEPKEDKKPVSKEELRIGGGKIPNEKGVHIGGGKLTAPEKK